MEYSGTTTSVVVMLEEQKKATGRELYSILGMGQEFVAEGDWGEKFFSREAKLKWMKTSFTPTSTSP